MALELSERVRTFGVGASRLAELPDLAEIQKSSFKWFIDEGLGEELRAFSPIKDYTGRLELHFLPSYTFEDHTEPNKPKTPEDARSMDASFTKKLRIQMRLVNREIGEIKEQEIYVGDIPMMTDRGTFIINGAERVIVSQIVRSPGIYYKREVDTNGKRTFSATLIPNRGAWLKFETDVNDVIYVKIDKNRKLPATTLLRALGYSDAEMESLFRHRDFLKKTLDKDSTKSREDSLIEVYRKLRPGDPPSVAGGQSIIDSRFFDDKRYDLGKVGRYKLNKKLGLSIPETSRTLSREDIVAAVDYLIGLHYDEGHVDDIDHLGNRRIRSVGELLQNQFRIGLTRLERIVRERMTLQDADTLTPANLLNTKPLVAAIREFFGSSQLSQFMDQTNPLAELTHKRRLSALGPGGLSRERAGFAVRDIHPSHYGRICPVETPEGPNAGLIGSLATHARVNEYGFIETPYRKVLNGRVSGEVHYLTADEEDKYRVAPGDVPLKNNGDFVHPLVPVRYKAEFIETNPEQVDYVGVSPIQIVSVGTALIPFLEHDDANRALMGSNMQRQSVPLVKTERALVTTGIEKQAARDSGMVVVSDLEGKVEYVSASAIHVRTKDKRLVKYKLSKFQRSNQDTCLNQKPIVQVGDTIKPGQIIADGAATNSGELAVGRNLLVAFMPWEGYNFEDAILISQRLVFDEVMTSIHIEKLEIDARSTKLGPEEITREVPNVSEESLRHLDETGIVRVGSRVYPDDILVGKITPKGESEHPPEEKLLRAIFGEKARDVRDNSLRVPHGEGGRVVDVKVFDREKGDELPPVANKVVRVYIAQKRKISVGDKVAGRHGNKGIVAKILPVEDMPFLPDGTAVDIVLNPLGVPSRMNVGQTFETLLGLAAMLTGNRYEVPPFDEMFAKEASSVLVHDEIKKGKAMCPDSAWVGDDGKSTLYDGRSGAPFDNPVTVGRIYMMKLVHLVDDKIHARSTGPYSLVTQQPLGGKAQFGGQRLGEMECWALEAFGSAYSLQEMLTIKSDDVNGRSRAYESIVKGENLKRPGIPESFKVLVRELQSIGLDVSVAKRTREGGELEVDLMTEVEEARPRGLRRMSPFSEIGIESELAELGRQPVVPSAAVAVSEPDEEVDTVFDSGGATVGVGGGGDDAEDEVEAEAEDTVAEIGFAADDEADDEASDDI
jgi:DNA-directed RNA polymerase subunit beta